MHDIEFKMNTEKMPGFTGSFSFVHLQKKENRFANQFLTAPSSEERRKHLKMNQRVRKMMEKIDFTICRKKATVV